jgi:hypothetical protein
VAIKAAAARTAIRMGVAPFDIQETDVDSLFGKVAGSVGLRSVKRDAAA